MKEHRTSTLSKERQILHRYLTQSSAPKTPPLTSWESTWLSHSDTRVRVVRFFVRTLATERDLWQTQTSALHKTLTDESSAVEERLYLTRDE